jgi:hypothetical protein
MQKSHLPLIHIYQLQLCPVAREIQQNNKKIQEIQKFSPGSGSGEFASIFCSSPWPPFSQN